MFRWFADLPIERKLRVVITVPAMAAFAVAILMHVATNLLHLRADMKQRAAGIARTAGVSAIEALGRGDTAAAISALVALRDEPSVDFAEVYLPDGQRIATGSLDTSVRIWNPQDGYVALFDILLSEPN